MFEARSVLPYQREMQIAKATVPPTFSLAISLCDRCAFFVFVVALLLKSHKVHEVPFEKFAG